MWAAIASCSPRRNRLPVPGGDAAALEQGIETALEQRAHWPQIRAQARRFVEQERTWANSVARYAEVYRRALAQRGRPVPAMGT
jgi:glycosyltransferase involved in cell wall biosynthesis